MSYQKYLPIPKFQRFSLSLSLKSLIVFTFTCCLLYILSQLLSMLWGKGQSLYFSKWITVPAPFGAATFSLIGMPWHLCWKSLNHLLWVCFWTISVPLVYMSVLLLLSHCLIYYNFIESLEKTLIIVGHFHFHKKFRLSLSN